ncbi:MAG: laccase domain-containing protein [Eggerthellaceae bacterium]|nr:laccase domain-containing protein [Eggerthellaceae bacterium]
MSAKATLPLPVLDALPLGARRLVALTDKALFANTGVRIAFTGRDGGVSTGQYSSLNCASHVGDDIGAVTRNRRIVCEAAGVPDAQLVAPSQVHGTELIWATEEGNPEADGVLVGVSGVAALLNSADCLLFVIVSPTGKFAVVHAGWRGAIAHIALKAARELVRGDDALPPECNAYIGPHIRSECFEVGPDVESRFKDEFGDVAVSAPRHVSLAAAVSADLVTAGLLPERIADAHICTKCNPDRYFSYRATSGNCGRHSAFAVAF